MSNDSVAIVAFTHTHKEHLKIIDDLKAQLATAEKREAARPHIVCLCGSTRFMDAFFATGWQFTLEGKIVLSVGVCKHTDAEGGHGAEMIGPDVADQLDELHLRKIDLADSVFVLNVGGYIGESTAKEIAYAQKTNKPIGYLEQALNPKEPKDGQ